MELAAIIATAIVVILQIITIALVVGNRKTVRDQVGKASPTLSNEKNEERKERDFRVQNRRPVQDQRPKPPTQQPANTGTVETVEKSLRDINLKLKNAERDQEFARRKVQENFPKDSNRRPNGNERNPGNDRPSGNDRNNRGNRDNRDRDGRERDNRDRDGRDRDSRHGGHDRNRSRGGNWQERNKARETLTFGPAAQSDENQTVENHAPILAQNQTPVISEPVVQTPVSANTDSAPDLVPVDVGFDDGLQHGRKILVKRRMLKEDDAQQSDGSSESNVSSDNSSVSVASEYTVNNDNSSINSSANNETSEKSSGGEIRFGRR